MVKALCYARVSTEEQAQQDRTSLPYQRQQLLNYCAKKGYEALEVIEDGGYSGTTDKRPGLLRMKQLAQDKAFDVLVAYDSSRLAREPFIKGVIKQQLRQAGIRIEYIAESYDDTDAGEMSEGVMDWLNWFVARQSAGKAYAGLHFLAEQGKLLPSYARLGYDWDKLDEKGHKAKGAQLIKNDKEEALIHLIFDLYEKMSQKKVALYLNEQGKRLPCKSVAWRQKWDRSERLFSPTDIRDIILDELYTGMIVWGRSTSDKRRKPDPQRKWFPELQIITFEQFNRCQRISQERKIVPMKSVGSPYIYSGLLKCPYCGGSTVGKRQRHPDYGGELTKRYECRNYHNFGRQGCKGWSAFEQTITKAVIPFLVDIFENKLPLHKYVEAEARNMHLEAQEDKLGWIEAALQEAKVELARLQDGVRKGIFTPDEAQLPALQARERIERAQKQLDQSRQKVEVEHSLAEAAQLVCADIPGALERLNGDEVREVVRQVVTSFTIGKRGYGLTQKAWVETYEFRDDFKLVLAQYTPFASHTPAWDIV
jgi:site-specific DNA recombinase